LASQKPEIFSIMSQCLAAQFKCKTNRTMSIDSIGPESPIFPKETPFRSGPSSAERNNNHSNVGSEYLPIHSGFNSVRKLSRPKYDDDYNVECFNE
jgi:hypothetical protein